MVIRREGDASDVDMSMCFSPYTSIRTHTLPQSLRAHTHTAYTNPSQQKVANMDTALQIPPIGPPFPSESLGCCGYPSSYRVPSVEPGTPSHFFPSIALTLASTLLAPDCTPDCELPLLSPIAEAPAPAEALPLLLSGLNSGLAGRDGDLSLPNPSSFAVADFAGEPGRLNGLFDLPPVLGRAGEERRLLSRSRLVFTGEVGRETMGEERRFSPSTTELVVLKGEVDREPALTGDADRLVVFLTCSGLGARDSVGVMKRSSAASAGGVTGSPGLATDG